MPIYEYQCKKCKTVRTVLKTLKDADSEERCILCNSKMKRLTAPSSVVTKFVGKGFHCNDYK